MDLNRTAQLLAVEMTANTGELWRAVINDERNPAIQSPSAYMSLANHWNTKRLQIHACAPRGMQERTTGETITCDPGRKAEAIARDICARLLPHARAHMIESIAYDRERKRQEAEKKLRLHFLQKYLPREYQPEKFCNSTSMKRGNIFAHITYENLINIEITVPLREAIKILEHLRNGEPSHESATRPTPESSKSARAH